MRVNKAVNVKMEKGKAMAATALSDAISSVTSNEGVIPNENALSEFELSEGYTV